MPTAGDQITRALRILGVLAEGETGSSETMQDCLIAFNQMLDSWSIERLSVFSTQTQVFNWPANQTTRTLGPTGDFIGNRPVKLDDSTYFVDSETGVSYGIMFINQEQYNTISVKSVTSTYPQVMFVNMKNPNIEMTVYPKPTKQLQWYFVSVDPLSQAANLSTELVFPPGYQRTFVYNLAMEVAPEFGIEPSPQVKRIAMVSKRNIKRINNPGDIMSMPSSIVLKNPRYNIYSGNF